MRPQDGQPSHPLAAFLHASRLLPFLMLAGGVNADIIDKASGIISGAGSAAGGIISGAGSMISDAGSAISSLTGKPSHQQLPSPRPPLSPPGPPMSPTPTPPLPPPLNTCFAARGWGPRGEGFAGSVAVTATGRECQPWGQQWPHAHKEGHASRTTTSMNLVANYCRNPPAYASTATREAPWCFTMDPDTIWEYCSVCEANATLLAPVPPAPPPPEDPLWVGITALCLVGILALSLVCCITCSRRACSSVCRPLVALLTAPRSTHSSVTVAFERRQKAQGGAQLEATTGRGTLAALASLAAANQQPPAALERGEPRCASLLANDALASQPATNTSIHSVASPLFTTMPLTPHRHTSGTAREHQQDI